MIFIHCITVTMSCVDKENQISLWWILVSLTNRDVTFLTYVITEQAGALEATGSPESTAFNLLDPQVCPG